MSIDSEIVDKVLAILSLSTDVEDKRRKIEREIRLGLGYVSRTSKTEMASRRYGVVTDIQKKTAAKVEVAIRRLQATLHDPNLVRHHLPRYSTDAADEDDAFKRFNADLEWLRQRYEANSRTPLREKRHRAVDWSKHEAAKTAKKVCKICGLPLSLGKTSPFVRIAALLLGEEGADLRDICRTVGRELRPE